ncbi:MAG: patatin-like phospholipase family protein [Actinomycetia bacterium]|nr:patatin-like phospholipase family protein [Actinomycetes bacterium]
MSLGLVLSGGGTKGAFEVGALEYLTRNADFAPQVISGTSVGALIGGPLAQGATGQDFQRLTQVVRQNALSVTDINAVFGQKEWLSLIADTPMGQFVHELISVRTRPPLPVDGELRRDPLHLKEPARRHRTLYAMSTAITNSPKLLRAGKSLLADANSIMDLNPLEQGYRGQAELGVNEVHEQFVADSGVRLRLCITNMRDGRPRYVTETGAVVLEDSITVSSDSGVPGVIEGMLASSSVPMMFPPRRIGPDSYVDGGIVQNTPLEAAVLAGATDIVAILAAPLRIPQSDVDYTQASMAAVYARAAADVGPNEVQRANLRYPLPPGGQLTTIAPTVDVVGGFEVEAGLIEIDFDYGWLRAAEVDADLTAADRAHLHTLSDEIAEQRERAWFLEDRLLANGFRVNLASALRKARARVVAASYEWRTAGLPPRSGMPNWGLDWEQHRQPIPTELHAAGQVSLQSPG